MPVQVCPRCQHINPEVAVYCHFDGALLQGGNGAPAGQLARDFTFPSGRRCRTFDEFAVGCQEEWVAARDLLRQGVFQQYFGVVGRADLARLAQEAMGQADHDIGLTSLLGALPVSRTLQPRLDIQPRRLVLGRLLAGEVRQVQVVLSNQGQGRLQGTMKISEGSDWLSIPGHGASCPIATEREQKVTLEVTTRKLVALRSFAGKLTVISNGGIVEVPVGLEVAAQPFAKAPYQGVKTPREMAERMRTQPKAAVPLLESGEVARWFASNNWNFPVGDHPIKGVAGVQQFFEAMGLSKPPPLQLSQADCRIRCNGPAPVRFQVTLSTPTRKWVYALIESDQPWLRVLTPEVSGPQRANIAFEVDGRSLPYSPAEGTLSVLANAGQKLPVRVFVEADHVRKRPPPLLPSSAAQVRAAAPAGTAVRAGVPVSLPDERIQSGPAPLPPRVYFEQAPPSWLGGIVSMALLFFLLRLGLVPIVDYRVRGPAVLAAAARLHAPVPSDHPLARTGGWLRLPWFGVLAGADGTLSAELFAARESSSISEFRHYFAKFFIRDVVLWTWWLGPIFGVLLVWRRGGGVIDWPWAFIAGCIGGVIGSVTLASLVLVGDLVPHSLWHLLFSDKGDGSWLVLWVVLALGSWTALGAMTGLVGNVIAPLRRNLIMPAQGILGGLGRRRVS